tara:strand:+ start:1367 stop:2305 length:939 start_codon:yes stop_codon:yes gene_type:complete
MKKILLYVNSIIKLDNKSLTGGIEYLNLNLYSHLKNKHNVFLTNKITKFHKNKKWDIIISSNDARIFSLLNSKRNILWLHNKLQLEKAIRKFQLIPILFNNIEAVFVSKFLKENTSNLYFFNKKIIIPNFLGKIFSKQKFNFIKKKDKNFVWSVQREHKLNDVIDLWKNQISKNDKKAKLHIFGTKKRNPKEYKDFNIFFHGRVSRQSLIHYYKKSSAMICLGYDETFCLNAIEAMSQGLPIISLGITSLKELLINNYNGFKIDKIDDLPNIVSKIINHNNSQKIKISKNSIKFSNRFHFSKIKKKWDFLIN